MLIRHQFVACRPGNECHTIFSKRMLKYWRVFDLRSLAFVSEYFSSVYCVKQENQKTSAHNCDCQGLQLKTHDKEQLSNIVHRKNI